MGSKNPRDKEGRERRGKGEVAKTRLSTSPLTTETNTTSGKKIIGKALHDVDRISNSETLDEYLADLPDLQKYFKTLKEQLLFEFEELVWKSEGTPMKENVQKLRDDLHKNFESLVLKILQAIHARENPLVIERLLAFLQAPRIRSVTKNLLSGIFGGQKEIPLPRGVYGEVYVEPLSLALSLEAPAHLDYTKLYSTMVHEFIHFLLQGEIYHRAVTKSDDKSTKNFPIKEGFTQLITEKVCSKTEEEVYPGETSIAEALFALDEEATLEWYVGGDDDVFRQKLAKKLPAELIQRIFALPKLKKKINQESYHATKQFLESKIDIDSLNRLDYIWLFGYAALLAFPDLIPFDEAFENAKRFHEIMKPFRNPLLELEISAGMKDITEKYIQKYIRACNDIAKEIQRAVIQ